jgi:hypothetical protein
MEATLSYMTGETRLLNVIGQEIPGTGQAQDFIVVTTDRRRYHAITSVRWHLGDIPCAVHGVAVFDGDQCVYRQQFQRSYAALDGRCITYSPIDYGDEGTPST